MKEGVAVVTKGKLAAGLASVGVAVAVLFPASAHAATCIDLCGGPGSAGLTNALTVLITNPSNANVAGGVPDAVAVVTVSARLASNHNETVLTLA
jgi:hypothetical protein